MNQYLITSVVLTDMLELFFRMVKKNGMALLIPMRKADHIAYEGLSETN